MGCARTIIAHLRLGRFFIIFHYAAGAGIEKRRGIMSIQRKTAVEKVIHALKAFFEENGRDGTSSVYATTRDIANLSELSIYNTRHVLIKLEQEGVVTSVKRENRKSLFWDKTDLFRA